MSTNLLEKIRKARLKKVESHGHTFTIRRPTDLEAGEFFAGKTTQADLLRNFVSGWDLTEQDIYPAGTADPAPFSAELWAEWVADRPEHWQPLVEAIVQAYEDHVAGREERGKNS